LKALLSLNQALLSASVNFATASVVVEYDESTITADEIREAVQSVGFGLMIENKSNENQDTR
jgi:P-type Cu2+ transporter